MKVPWGNGSWQRVLVYGLGASGTAAVRLLRAHGVEVVGLDRRPASELELGPLAADPGVEVREGKEPAELPPGLDGVVVSPGVPLDRPLLRAARRQGLPVVAEVELAYPFLEGPVVGITGSNGKSTTTRLAGQLLAASGLAVEVCGNIGRPVCDCVEGPPGRVFVVELSSFQLEAVDTFRPRAAAVLNLSPDHLDRYPDLAAYGRAKAVVFAAQGTDDTVVLNADDPWVSQLVAVGRRRFFSRRQRVEDGCYLESGVVVEARPEGERELFAAADLALPGLHNLENAMAATLLALAVGGTAAEVPSVLAAAEGLPHRLQRVATWRGVEFWDDSKGTNPGATLGSLAGFADHSVHLILGGRSKGTELRSLLPAVAQKVRRAYLIGEAAEEFAAALDGLVPWERCGDLERAVAAAAAAARSGEAVLLSPACASFDQYRSFEERGGHFQRLVAMIEEGPDGQEAGL